VDVTVWEGHKAPSVHTQSRWTTTDLHIAGVHAMKGLAEKPLDGGASTHQWARAGEGSHDDAITFP
jgi:hypothetical protein